MQHMAELEEFLALQQNPPELDAGLAEIIKKDREELSGAFCRGCGYCLPCPVGIPIHMAARMPLLLQRAPSAPLVTKEWQESMARIADCTGCGHCTAHCPYGLDTPALLKANLLQYQAYLERQRD
jgi:predicted aldo/keto reductase-like oxidoreductase